MYSWTTIRTAAAVLLLIPIVHLVFLLSRETMATLDQSPEVWADEVEAYSRLDQRGELPTNPVVVVGGRRVSLWRDLQDTLAPMVVLNRAIGDGTTNDITYYYQRLIGFYRPHSVVLLPGDSEFHLRENKSAKEMVQAIRKLVELDLSHGSTQHFYVISPLKTPLYSSNKNKIDKTTRLLKDWAAPLENVHIIDANTLLSDRDGNAKPAYYRSDGVHLNEHGYVRLSIMLRVQFEKNNPGIYTAGLAP